MRREVETDCGRYRSYLEAKRQQLLLLGKLKKAAGLAVAVNAYTDLKPTVEAIDLNPETLTDMRQPLKLQPRQLKASELDDLLGEQQEARLLCVSRFRPDASLQRFSEREVRVMGAVEAVRCCRRCL